VAAMMLLPVAVAIAGCGDGSDSGEAGLRARLEEGAAKLEHARSFSASILFQAETEDEPLEPGEGPCVNIYLDRRKPPLRAEILSFDSSCSGGQLGADVIIVGDRVWSGDESGRYGVAKVAPRLIDRLPGEFTKFKKLLAAASHIHEGEAGAYSTATGDFRSGPTIEFTAPASSFSTVGGSGSTEVKFSAVLDRQGYLRELVATVGEEGPSVILTQTYEEIDRPQKITPPDPKEVSGPVTRISSRKDLEALIESPRGF
jgi:hypothetical protein